MIGHVIDGQFLRVQRLPDGGRAVVHADGDDPGAGVGLRAAGRDGGAGLMATVTTSTPDRPPRRAAAPAPTQGPIALGARAPHPDHRVLRVRLHVPADRRRRCCSRSTSRRASSTTTSTQFSLNAWTAPVRAARDVRLAGAQPARSACVATLVATILGTLVAFALARYRFRGRAATNLLIFMPMATPEVVMGSSLLTLFVSLTHPARLRARSSSRTSCSASASWSSPSRPASPAWTRGWSRRRWTCTPTSGRRSRRITLPLVAPGHRGRRAARVLAVVRRLHHHELQLRRRRRSRSRCSSGAPRSRARRRRSTSSAR